MEPFLSLHARDFLLLVVIVKDEVVRVEMVSRRGQCGLLLLGSSCLFVPGGGGDFLHCVQQNKSDFVTERPVDWIEATAKYVIDNDDVEARWTYRKDMCE